MGALRAWAALGLALLMLGSPVALAQPQRILSLNLCTDQLLVDLAPRAQILGLSPFARDAARSWAALRMAELPILSGTAEEVIFLKPDLVVSSRYMKRETRALVAARKVPLAEFADPMTLDEARAQIAEMGRLIGAEEAAARRLAAFDAALAELRRAALETPLRILPIARRGWVSGRGTLLADLLRQAGLVHAGGDLGFETGGFAALEAVIAARPDAILTGQPIRAAEDQGQAKLIHPALARLFPPERQIHLPEPLTICGGPALIEGMRHLAAEMRRLAALPPR